MRVCNLVLFCFLYGFGKRISIIDSMNGYGNEKKRRGNGAIRGSGRRPTRGGARREAPVVAVLPLGVSTRYSYRNSGLEACAMRHSLESMHA